MKGNVREDLCFCPPGALCCGGAGGALLALVAVFSGRGGMLLFRLPVFGWGSLLSAVFAAALLGCCGVLMGCLRRPLCAGLCGGGLFFLLLWAWLFFAGSTGIPSLFCLALSVLCSLIELLRLRFRGGLGSLLLALTAPFFFCLLWLHLAEMLVI